MDLTQTTRYRKDKLKERKEDIKAIMTIVLFFVLGILSSYKQF